jgi:hypothetical protein
VARGRSKSENVVRAEVWMFVCVAVTVAVNGLRITSGTAIRRLGGARDDSRGLDRELGSVEVVVLCAVRVHVREGHRVAEEGSQPVGKCMWRPSAASDSASSRRRRWSMVLSNCRVSCGPWKTSAPPTDPR